MVSPSGLAAKRISSVDSWSVAVRLRTASSWRAWSRCRGSWASARVAPPFRLRGIREQGCETIGVWRGRNRHHPGTWSLGEEYADASIPNYWIVDIEPPVSLLPCHPGPRQDRRMYWLVALSSGAGCSRGWMSRSVSSLGGWFQCWADIGDRRDNQTAVTGPGVGCPAGYCAPRPTRYLARLGDADASAFLPSGKIAESDTKPCSLARKRMVLYHFQRSRTSHPIW